MNEASHNFLNHLKSTSSTSTDGWPIKEIIVRGTPESNREIIDATRDMKQRALMDKNAEEKLQLYLQDYGLLYPFDVVGLYQDGTVKVSKFIE